MNLQFLPAQRIKVQSHSEHQSNRVMNRNAVKGRQEARTLSTLSLACWKRSICDSSTSYDLQTNCHTYMQGLTDLTRGSAIAEEPRDALRQLKYYGRFLTELLTRSSGNPEEPCEHTVS